MPALDDRLTRALGDAALEPRSTADVLGAVATKQRQRATRRRARTAGAAVCAVALFATLATVVVRAGGDDPVAVANRPAGDGLALTVVDGSPATLEIAVGDTAVARPVTLDPDRGYVRGPVLASGEFVAVAAYDRDGATFSFPPSRVVRIDGTGRVLDEVDLQGEIRSLADGEGARWVLTRDAVVLGPADPEYRVKRIGPDGTVESSAVPPGEQPVGDITAEGGGVWVPVADGVLRFDPASGAYAGKIDLEPVASRRVVSLGKGVAATTPDGLARLDPSSMVALGPNRPAAQALEIVDAALGTRSVWALVASADGPVLVAADGQGALDPSRAVALPRGFVAEGLQSAGQRLWVTGRVGDHAAVVVLRELADGRSAVVERAVTVDRPGDAAFAVTDHRTLAIALDGSLWALAVD